MLKSRSTLARIALGATLLLAGPALASAPPFGFMPVTETYQFRPLEQGSQGVPPVTPPPIGYGVPASQPGPRGAYGFPGGRPAYGPPSGWPGVPSGQPYGMGYGQPQYAAGQAIKLETTLSASDAYTQQNLVYTLRILSDDNLRTADPVLPETDGLVFQPIDGPVTRTEVDNGRQKIVNEFHYAVTPVRVGALELEPAHVTGEMAQSGRAYDVSASEPLKLNVKAAPTQMLPWLPLQDLSVQTRVKNGDKPAAGQPLTLEIEMKAVGATGAQLPSLEKQLESPDFRVYKEKTETHGMLSADGRQIEGRRVESFTLIPQHGGRVRIPSLGVNWWNLRSDRAETLMLPIRQLVANGGLRGEGAFGLTATSTLFPAGSPLVFWLPLLLVAFLLGAYWSWIWARRHGLARKILAQASHLLGPADSRIRQLVGHHSPRRYLHLARQGFILALPRSVRLWYCVRYVNGETEPRDWCQMFKFLANKHIGISPQLPMPEFGERLIASHPKVDALAMRKLMSELDSAIYGSESLDFEAWKRELRQQLRPRIIPAGRGLRALRRAVHKLPDLNPRPI